MTDIKASNLDTFPRSQMVDIPSTKEIFKGFTREDIKNCADRIVRLRRSPSDDKPITSREYKDINYDLEQKLINFYIYKNRQKKQHPMVVDFNRKSETTFSESYLHCGGGQNAKKRSYSGRYTARELFAQEGPVKRRKLDFVDSGELELSSAHARKCAHESSFSDLSDVSSVKESQPKKNSSSPSVPWILPGGTLVSSTNNVSLRRLENNGFSAVKTLQGPLNRSFDTNANNNFPTFPRSSCLRASKLNLKSEEKEKLKVDLNETLREEMKENRFICDDIDQKLRNLSRIIRESVRPAMSPSGFKATSPIRVLPPVRRSNVYKRQYGGLAGTPSGAASKMSNQAFTSKAFESLSDNILSRVRRMVESCDLFVRSDKNMPLITETVIKEGLIDIPDKGAALVISSAHLDSVVCFACGSAGRPPEDKLLFCNGCCEPYHRYCLELRVNEHNAGSWLCSKCQGNLYEEPSSSCAGRVIRDLQKIFASSSSKGGSPNAKSEQKRRCGLCFRACDLPSKLGGRLVYAGSNVWVHVNCILWSEGVREQRDGRLSNVKHTISTSKSRHCSRCNRAGASLKCALRSCPKRFHFSCAVASHCSFGRNTRVHCSKHSSALHRSNVSSVFRVRRKIFASDAGGLVSPDCFKKAVVVGSYKFIGLKSVDQSGCRFRSRRIFWSTRDPRKTCTYFCKVYEKISRSSDDARLAPDKARREVNEANENVRFHAGSSSIMRSELCKQQRGRCFDKLVQLDGTAGLDDSEGENDDTMDFCDFSGLIRSDDSRGGSSRATGIGPSGAPPPENSHGSNVVKPQTPNQSTPRPLQSTNPIRPSTPSSTSALKFASPSGKSPTLTRLGPNASKVFSGQVSYLGSVVAANLQSLLKPKQLGFSNCLNINKSPPRSTPIFSSEPAVITHPPKSTQVVLNQATVTKSPPKLSAVSSSEPAVAKNLPIPSVVPSKPTASVTSKATNNTVSAVKNNLRGEVKFLGSMSTANFRALLKPKTNGLSPLVNHEFPSVAIMPAASSRTSDDRGATNSSSAKVCESSVSKPTHPTPAGVSSPSTNTTSSSEHRSASSQEIPSSQTPCISSLLKPAVGFAESRPFSEKELMFSDSEEDDQEASRVFLDFDDFVNNFERKTNSISVPVLKLKRCDHIATRYTSPPPSLCPTSTPSSSSSSCTVASANSFYSTVISVNRSSSSSSSSCAVTSMNFVNPTVSLSSCTFTSANSTTSATAAVKKSSSLVAFSTNCLPSTVTASSSLPCRTISISTSSSASSCSMASRNSLVPSATIVDRHMANGSSGSGIPMSSLNALHQKSNQLCLSATPVIPNGFAVKTPPTTNSTTNPTRERPSEDLFTSSPMRSTMSGDSQDSRSRQAASPCATVSSSSKLLSGHVASTTESNTSVSSSTVGVANNVKNKSSCEKMVVFEIKSSDGFACTGKSADEAWSKVRTELASVRHKLSLKPISIGGIKGMTFFGLDHPVVINLINKCANEKQRQVNGEAAPTVERPTGAKEGCSRFVPFAQRKPLDHFHFLLSEHRKVMKIEDEADSGDEDISQSKTSGTNSDLPVSGRCKKMRSLHSVRRSRIHGRGLFAMRDVENGEMVIEYCGEIIRSVLTDSREKMYESKGIGCYMFRVDDNKVVDATMKGNAARFINHSCNPNCYSKIVRTDGSKRIVICATRFIKRGEEFTYNYKFPIEEGDKIPCRCRSKKCKKFMN